MRPRSPAARGALMTCAACCWASTSHLRTLPARLPAMRAHFHSYLHSLDVDREHLPDGFRQRLTRALAHYGVSDLERGPVLEEAVFRIFLAQRTASDLVVLPLLHHWMAGQQPVGSAGNRAREVLDRLVLATQLRCLL